ncbi:phospholipase A1-like [Eupeodes corollae]|uniref:phospholipase A1-like n=1 Tax=Eupeodes corollae TaxID=290404 RepID=UPI002490EBBB|nr:phospholipase A1-like [Eupeodes corollae]
MNSIPLVAREGYLKTINLNMKLSLYLIAVLVLAVSPITGETEKWDECGHDLSKPTGLDSLVDLKFLGRVLRSLVPFQKPDVTMHFYLYKRAFPTCGQELRMDDDSLQKSDFNKNHPTRIIIHGWLSQSKASLNRDIKDAYLEIGDFNVIIVDWSIASSTLNYYRVVRLIEDFGQVVADFAKHLHNTLGVDYDSIYLIGHSLGAQIAGSAGKRLKPGQFNTIFALDPAGPAFREKDLECRIDPTDAKYVESIQTSVNLGLLQPVGNATFFPNNGVYQKCLGFGCSHSRAYKFFAESIVSSTGFWGTVCDNETRKWHCPEKGKQYKMGGEPSSPKSGTFYVRTRTKSPYAIGKNLKYVYS